MIRRDSKTIQPAFFNSIMRDIEKCMLDYFCKCKLIILAVHSCHTFKRGGGGIMTAEQTRYTVHSKSVVVNDSNRYTCIFNKYCISLATLNSTLKIEQSMYKIIEGGCYTIKNQQAVKGVLTNLIISHQGLSRYLEIGCPNRGFIDFCVAKVWYKIHTTNKINPIHLQIWFFRPNTALCVL